MTLLDHLRRMARNNLWSNDRVYRAVLAMQPGEFDAKRTSLFPSIKETLNHILAVDRLYLDFLTDGGLGAAAYDDYVPFDHAASLAEAQADFDRKLIAFCDGLSEADLDRRVITDRREDGKIPERIGDILACLPARHPSSRPGARDALRHFRPAAAARRIPTRLRPEAQKG